jgi:PAS domain S-box-containing protein
MLMGPELKMDGAYDYRLVALSVVISVVASYAALHAVSTDRIGVASIALAATFLLCQVCYMAFVDRRFRSQARLLNENQLEVQAIFDNIADVIVLVDPARSQMRLNRTAVALLGCSKSIFTFDEMPGMMAGFEILLPNGAPLPLEQRPVFRALHGEFIRDFEIVFRKKDTGETFHYEFDTAPIPSRRGDAAAIILTGRDMTERKRIDAAHARLAAIVESSEDAIVAIDLNGTVTSWNKGSELVFGYSAEEMMGQSYGRLFPPGTRDEEAEEFARIAAGVMVAHSERVRVRKSGETINVSVSVSPIRDARGEIVGASKIARNITARKKLEKQTAQSQKMQALGELTGGIAHDFNNLLGVILGNLDLMERQIAGNDQAIKRMRTAQKAVKRGADLTRRLLAFSSREALNPAQVSIEATIDEVIELAGRTLGPEIAISARCDRDLPSVVVDAAGFASALLNLALNARDAMPQGGSLTFGAHLVEIGPGYLPVQTGELVPGNFVCITVSD